MESQKNEKRDIKTEVLDLTKAIIVLVAVVYAVSTVMGW
jgi:hypothetical protein